MYFASVIMSGICGLIDFEDAPGGSALDAARVLRVMAEASAHRGPDGIHCRSFDDAHLAHLALLSTPEAAGADRGTARQPLSERQAGVHLVADARIDNRPELLALFRHELEQRHPSDAALILMAYLRWGTACPEHLIGDFAFAIWDQPERRFFCARDPLGVKPLHYAFQGSLFCVASEAQQILYHPAIPVDFDEAIIGEFLCGGVADLQRSFFRGVSCLPPGHRLMATASGPRCERYWDIDPEKRLAYGNDGDYVEHFRDLLDRAVQDRLRTSGAVVGISMSGGLDSCSVAALAQRRLKVAGEAGGSLKLQACSFAFDKLEHCDERVYTRAMEEELGIQVAHIDTEEFWYLGDEEAYQPSLETPFMSWEGAFQNMLRGLADQGARVILTGHGGDGLVTGSSRIHADRLRRGDLRVVADIIKLSQASAGTGFPLKSMRWALYHHLVEPWMSKRFRDRFGKQQADSPIPPWLDAGFVERTDLVARMNSEPDHRRFRELARDRVYNHLVRYNGDGRVAYWLDRFSARFGIEARHPYFDQRLVEFVHAIPGDQLFRHESTKSLLRRAMVGILPKTVRQRTRKTQFGSFVDMGLREKEAGKIENLLNSSVAAEEFGILDQGKVLEAYRAYRDGDAMGDKARQVWYAITLELWSRHCLEFMNEKGRNIISGRKIAAGRGQI